MSSNSPCAACKFQRRKCTPECIFAPYFPPEDPQKFVNVHKVFGGSNVSKILGDINPAQREDAAKSLAYEARARLQDPVNGCVNMIWHLQHKLKQIHVDLDNAKKELAGYIGPSALLPTSYPQQAYSQMVYQPHHPQQQMIGNPCVSASALPYTNLMGNPTVYGAGTSQQLLVIHDQQQQQHQLQPQTALPYTSLMPSMMGAGDPSRSILIGEQQQQQHQQQHHEVDLQRYGVVTVEQHQNELMRSYEMQQQQHDYLLFKNSDRQYDENGVGQMVGSGFTQMGADHENGGGPCLALGVSYDNPSYSQIHQQHDDNVNHALHAQLLLQSQQQHSEQLVLQSTEQQHQHKAKSDEGRSV